MLHIPLRPTQFALCCVHTAATCYRNDTETCFSDANSQLSSLSCSIQVNIRLIVFFLIDFYFENEMYILTKKQIFFNS